MGNYASRRFLPQQMPSMHAFAAAADVVVAVVVLIKQEPGK
jgi:hypothetical protein